MALKDYTREKTSFRKVSVFYNGPGRRGNELRMRVSITIIISINAVQFNTYTFSSFARASATIEQEKQQ